MTSGKAIIVTKASRPLGGHVQDMRIEIIGEAPEIIDPAKQKGYMRRQAALIERALRDHLPAGVYDRLAGLMLARKASQLDMAHAPGIGQSEAEELLGAAKFAESVLRSQGLYDVSERLAVAKLEAAVARAEGLPQPEAEAEG